MCYDWIDMTLNAVVATLSYEYLYLRYIKPRLFS